MEAFGFAASIITIVDTSWKIVGYLEGVKHGGKSRRLLLEQVTLLWLVFQRLKEEIDLPKGRLADEPWVEPLKILDGPSGIAAQIREQLNELELQLTTTKGRFGEAMSTLRWPFQEKEATRIVSRLEELKQTTMLVIQQSSHRMNREIKEGLCHFRAVVDDTFYEKLLAWLTPLNFVRKQRDILGSADPYNCCLLASDSFRTWHDDDLRSLWCFGAPGAGKSVVAASVYADLIKQHKEDSVAVMIAFCSFDDEESQSPRNLIASLLKQVLQTRGSSRVPSKLKEHYSKAATSKDGQLLSVESLTEFLREELKTYDAAYVILDGLDEVSNIAERAAVVKAVHDIGAGAKVIITSRHSEDIIEALQRTQVCKECQTKDAQVYWRCINCASYVICENCHSATVSRGESKHQTLRELEWEGMWYQPRESDISNYVTTRLDSDRELRKLLGPDSGQEILRRSTINTVTEKSEKIFLLARLYVDSLADCLTVGALKRALKGLSGDLDQMYLKSLARMERSLRPKHLDILKKLLLWIAWGQRPLSIAELGHALAIHPGVEEIDEDDILPIREITTWSAGLLFIDSSDYVKVIHPTTSRFFVEHRDKLYPKGDSAIAHDCLHYLNIEILREPLSGPDQRSLFMLRRKAYPLLEYAVLHSFKHVVKSYEKDDDNRAAGFLLSDARRSFVQAMYHLDPEWSIETDASALHIAVYLGLTDVVSILIDEGEDVDARDFFGATPLMYAADRGNEGLPELKSLLDAGADASITCNAGSTALIRAVGSNAESLVTRLLRVSDVNINAIPSDGSTSSALITSVKSASQSIVKKLVARKDVDVNLPDGAKVGDLTPLHIAVIWRNIPAMKHLLARKDIVVDSTEPGQGWTPLYYCAQYGYADCMELLLDHGADINHQDSYQGTALMRAVDEDARGAVELLIKRGMDVKRRDFLGRTVLHSAAVNRSWDTMEYFLKDVPDIEIDAQGDSGETPLHDSCKSLDPHGASLLVDAGARCDIKDNEGRTPVDIATIKKRPDILELLKKAEGYSNTVGVHIKKTLREAVVADPPEILQVRIANVRLDELNTSSAFTGTPLHEACRCGRADVVEMLLRAGADIELTNSFGRTPICIVVEFGHLDCLRVLLDHGVDVQKSPFKDVTLWEHAWGYDHRDIALALIEHGARLDKSSGYLQNALHQAAYEDNIAVVRRVVEAGASIHQKMSGYTAIDWAESQEATAVLEYFATLDGEEV
ncbi:ankyrin [Colletotrichum somersetense]|nr:ankyrin [Colletotrichum somersetense]